MIPTPMDHTNITSLSSYPTISLILLLVGLRYHLIRALFRLSNAVVHYLKEAKPSKKIPYIEKAYEIKKLSHRAYILSFYPLYENPFQMIQLKGQRFGAGKSFQELYLDANFDLGNRSVIS